MSKEKQSIDLEPNKLYLVLNATKDENDEAGFDFAIYDRLEHNEDNILVACLLRGMIAYALEQTEDAVEKGAAAFKADYDTEVVDEHDFPKTVGNA